MSPSRKLLIWLIIIHETRYDGDTRKKKNQQTKTKQKKKKKKKKKKKENKRVATCEFGQLFQLPSTLVDTRREGEPRFNFRL